MSRTRLLGKMRHKRSLKVELAIFTLDHCDAKMVRLVSGLGITDFRKVPYCQKGRS